MTMTLFDQPVNTGPQWATDELGVDWWQFHLAHPEVYDELVRLSRRLVEKGYRHLGLKMLWETLRYNTMLGATPDEDDYRLNNNYTALYARLIMEQEKDLYDVFEVRVRRAT